MTDERREPFTIATVIAGARTMLPWAVSAFIATNGVSWLQGIILVHQAAESVAR